MKTQVLDALEAIRQQDGIIQPERVVDIAKDKDSPLHDCFTWNNAEAAHQWRVAEARMLLRVAVEIRPNLAEPVRVFVSLPRDRKQPGGGYRRMADVLSHDQMREELVHTALREMNATRQRYKELKELAELYAHIDKEVATRMPSASGASSASSRDAASQPTAG